MIFKDAKLPQDTIEVKKRTETHGDLIEIETQGDGAEVVYLNKESAKAMGELLIKLSVGLDAPPIDIKEKYFELIMAVSIKHPDESRHETALRYIVQAEKGSNEPCEAASI